MPLFPSPSLKFRTVGFPQSGFKAGISDGAFPANWFAVVLRTLCCHRYSRRCVWDDALISTSVRAVSRSTGPRSGPGYVVPVHLHLLAPSAPLAGTPGFHRLAAYTRCLRCAYLHRPRRPTTGSELSLMVFRNMSSSETTGNFSAAPTQCFAENDGLRLQLTVSAFPEPPHSDSGEGDCFRGFTTVRLCYGSR
jgi:hypothetical protein